jgi:AcrR family transcriptional regulator
MSTEATPLEPEVVATVPLRVDAQRNLARILAAAREVFAERGMEGSVEEIARRAGVGVGTIYRRFPTKDALIDAIVEERVTQMAEVFERHLADEDAWAGFRAAIMEVLNRMMEDRALHDVMKSRFGPPPAASMLRVRAVELVQRAQAAGGLRADFTPQDLMLLFSSVNGVMEATQSFAPRAWERFLSFLLDGLAAEAATPPPVEAFPAGAAEAAKAAAHAAAANGDPQAGCGAP